MHVICLCALFSLFYYFFPPRGLSLYDVALAYYLSLWGSTRELSIKACSEKKKKNLYN